MAKIDERQVAIARLYAQAMLEVAEERGEAEELLEELEGLGAYVEESPELLEFLQSPLVDSEDRGTTLERLFRGRTSDLLADSLGVLNKKGRLGFLPAIVGAYRHEYMDHRGFVDVHVTSAVELSPALRQRLQQVAERFTGKKVNMREEVDPSILGGLVVQVDNTKLDGSAARNLEKLSHALADQARHQILAGGELIAEA